MDLPDASADPAHGSRLLSGDKVTGATVNTTGSFVMRAERVGGGTLLAQIVHMVAEAQRSRAPIQSLVDTISAWLVTGVVLTAAVAFIAWAIWGHRRRWALRSSTPSRC